MKSKYQKIKGTFDILPPDTRLWREVEDILHNISQQFSYEEIRTPALESIHLFKQNVGYETDVSKEMFEWIQVLVACSKAHTEGMPVSPFSKSL